ncbi:MAG: hypothetical protein ACRDIL_13590, partial [Candidatus Limnocylindrales bacterium]
MTIVQPDQVNEDDIEREDAGPSRRAWLKHVAIGAAGATAGALALGKNASAGDSAGTALGGNATELGLTNTSTLPTIIDYTGTAITEGPSVFSAGPTVPAADAPFPASVGGYGDADVANGVHGSTVNATGYG